MFPHARLLNYCRPLWVESGRLSCLTKCLIYFCRSAAHAHNTNYAMDKAYLRKASDSEDLHISFRYNNNSYNIDREFNFCRNINENVDDALTRIRNNIEKELNKKTKKSKRNKNLEQERQPDLGELCVEFGRSGCDSRITNITFAEMLGNRTDLLLKVVDQTYEIVFNQPWVLNLVLPTSILAGFLVYPSKVEMQFSERVYSRGTWFKAKMPSSGDLKKGAVWIKCGNGFFYRTTNDDVGHFMKFTLTPGNADQDYGPDVEAITKKEVQANPGVCPFETRQSFTANILSGNELRVVSYNILADLYADSDYSRTQLFPYCPPYALKMDYRKQLFIKEIVGYHADIVCLQEVDMKIFDFDLKPVLESESAELVYTGLIQQKGTSGEGVATFFRRDRFELIRTYGLNIGESIQKLPEFEALWLKICGNEKLVERICDRATTLQISLLKCIENEKVLLVANTHLYFHPDADHIRLLQIGFAMRYIEHIKHNVQEELKLPKDNIALVFCGDFNSVPECGIYKLMTENFVGPDFIDWNSNQCEAVKNVCLTQAFKMRSACGTPPYTNYTHAFAACLDYIFYECDKFEVQQVVPLPDEEELKAHTAIPSVVFPSDHVALVADLIFKTI